MYTVGSNHRFWNSLGAYMNTLSLSCLQYVSLPPSCEYRRAARSEPLRTAQRSAGVSYVGIDITAMGSYGLAHGRCLLNGLPGSCRDTPLRSALVLRAFLGAALLWLRL